MKDKSELPQIIEKVRERLSEQFPGEIGFNVEVLPEEIEEIDDYWHIPVQPEKHPPKMYYFYEVLAEVEEKLETEDQLPIHLVPLEPAA
jgi:hypothetical protein